MDSCGRIVKRPLKPKHSTTDCHLCEIPPTPRKYRILVTEPRTRTGDTCYGDATTHGSRVIPATIRVAVRLLKIFNLSRSHCCCTVAADTRDDDHDHNDDNES